MSEFIENDLKIDSGFKNLIPPLSSNEYAQLQQNLINEGCREPICIWNDYILDGHSRYEICISRNIPFQIRHIKLQSYEDAIIWICINQLGRRNISDEARRYLIGKRYEAEKVIGARNAVGRNQYTRKVDRPQNWVKPLSGVKKPRTAERLGNEYHVTHNTIGRYYRYAQAVDTLAKTEPEIIPKILTGQVKISHDNIVELANLPNTDFSDIRQNLYDEEAKYVSYSETHREIKKNRIIKPNITAQLPSGSIKNMPEYDPDAGVSSLVLTIPSWITSIERTRSTVDLNRVSGGARDKLFSQLINLKETIEDILAAIKEENQ